MTRKQTDTAQDTAQGQTEYVTLVSARRTKNNGTCPDVPGGGYYVTVDVTDECLRQALADGMAWIPSAKSKPSLMKIGDKPLARVSVLKGTDLPVQWIDKDGATRVAFRTTFVKANAPAKPAPLPDWLM